MNDKEKEEIYREFHDSVNMAPAELEKWLKTEESRSVGQDSGDGESVGHKSGKRIIEIKRKKKAELTPADYDHMKKVHGYVARHTAQQPEGDISGTNWLYSLKNWGYDPCKEQDC